MKKSEDFGVGERQIHGQQVVVALTSLQIRDIAEARGFYQEALGCLEGHRGDKWLEVNLYGHPIVCRLNPQLGKRGRVVSHYQLVDGKYVPIAHGGVVLGVREWRSLVRRLKQRRVKFAIEPCRDTKSAPGARAKLLLLDPSGNALEVRSFCSSTEECLRYERQRALARWLTWAILTAFIVCCIVLLPKKSEIELAVGNLSLTAHSPQCASARSCVP